VKQANVRLLTGIELSLTPNQVNCNSKSLYILWRVCARIFLSWW